MDDSPPATSASERVATPEATAAPEGTAAQEERLRGGRRRFRVPTSVIVTIVVAALSVWVAPAFTRQWDDRQRARELQVGLVELVSSTTAQVQADQRSLAFSSNASPWARRAAIVARWEFPRLKVETRLRVYYGEQGLKAWRSYERAVSAFGDLAEYEARTPNRSKYDISDEHLRALVREIGLRSRIFQSTVRHLKTGNQSLREWHLEHLAGVLGGRASRLIDLIVRKAPNGFSTTRGDLLRDLLP